jgi:hypothetical protein
MLPGADDYEKAMVRRVGGADRTGRSERVCTL